MKGTLNLSTPTASTRSNFILRKGEVVWVTWYRYPKGNQWIVKYRNKFYHIIDDGTKTQYIHFHDPQLISAKEAQRLLSMYPEAYKRAHLLGWWNETLEEYLEKEFNE